ncbi:odorant receptor 13a-like isoform X2 [Vespula squamosa]|uniref:Odorant receptor 13a-like isoform X2 n=1 Tax=Vespula squamosa TaxID=30214 RepID=A0ABD2BG28_VESSQ
MIEQFSFKFYRTLTYFMKTFGLNFKEIEQLYKKCRLDYSFRTDFSNTLRAVTFCKRVLLYSYCLIYGCLYNLLALLDFTTYIKNFRYVIANIMENMLVLMTVIKISVLRIKCSSLLRFLMETKADNTADNYKNDEERLIFFKYNNLFYKFIIILFP